MRKHRIAARIDPNAARKAVPTQQFHRDTALILKVGMAQRFFGSGEPHFHAPAIFLVTTRGG